MKRDFARATALLAATAFWLCLGIASAQPKSMQQLLAEHIDLRFGMFIHFNMNTFFPGWAEPRTDPKTFNPTSLDCTQWARAAKSAGVRYAILTAKHHDGFSIWPSLQRPPNGQPRYTIAESSAPTRDVVREYVDAFRAQGILPGLYFSMWDVANIGGSYQSPGYSDSGPVSWAQVRPFILGQISELLGGAYGDIPIFVIDGYSWSMGHRQVPYQEIHDLIKRLQPNCLIVDHNGGLPWEVDVVYFEEPIGVVAPAGNITAAGQGQTISSDWFWNVSAADPAQLLSVAAIVNDHLRTLEPLYTNFILNCPPNRSGLLDQAIVDRLAAVGAAWTPNIARAPLPAQLPKIETPMTPLSAMATSGDASLVIDNLNDYSRGPRSQTLWQSTGALPQSVTLDLGSLRDGIDMLEYLPRREPGVTTGNITSYRILVSTDGVVFTEAASGQWPANPVYHGLISPQRARFPSSSARYVRLEAIGVAGGAAAIAGEVAVGKGESAIAATADGGSATDASVVDGRGPDVADVEVGQEKRSPESDGTGGNAPTIDADVGDQREASIGPSATATADAAREAEAPAARAPASASKGCNCSVKRAAGLPRSLVLAALAVWVAVGRRRVHRQT